MIEQIKFTSHYVSINSHINIINVFKSSVFTSHYVSINSPLSNAAIANTVEFTSHYVSINSQSLLNY